MKFITKRELARKKREKMLKAMYIDVTTKKLGWSKLAEKYDYTIGSVKTIYYDEVVPFIKNDK